MLEGVAIVLHIALTLYSGSTIIPPSGLGHEFKFQEAAIILSRAIVGSCHVLGINGEFEPEPESKVPCSLYTSPFASLVRQDRFFSGKHAF